MAPTETHMKGVDDSPASSFPTTNDPFASHRETKPSQNDEKTDNPDSPSSPVDRRASTDEWDASKTPPSRFQQRKGSVYATPSSRDSHVGKNQDRDAKFHRLVEEKYGGKRRASNAKSDKDKNEKLEA